MADTEYQIPEVEITPFLDRQARGLYGELLCAVDLYGRGRLTLRDPDNSEDENVYRVVAGVTGPNLLHVECAYCPRRVDLPEGSARHTYPCGGSLGTPVESSYPDGSWDLSDAFRVRKELEWCATLPHTVNLIASLLGRGWSATVDVPPVQ